MRNGVFYSEKNENGGITVHGVIGDKQFYGYTRQEAEKEYSSKVEINSSVKKDVKK